jgi:hypothetical protein
MKTNYTNSLFYAIAIIFVLFYQNIQAQYTSRIISTDSTRNMLEVVHHLSSKDSVVYTKRLPYPVYKYYQADIDNDGIDEFLVGSIRITILDSTIRKRINIWRLDSKGIVPMWLGSKMPHPVYDFEVNRSANKTRIRTIEFEQNELFLVAEYEWHSFGLKFVQYIKRQKTLEEASILIKTYENPNP